jgi:hypothetical protein
MPNRKNHDEVKRPAGRPRLGDEERTPQRRVRVPTPEWESWVASAERQGISVSELIRTVVSQWVEDSE